MFQHEDDPLETAFLFSQDEALEIVETFNRVKNDLMFLRAKFQAEVVVRRPKKDPLLKAWLTDNLLLISFIWQILNIIVLHMVGAYDPNSTDNVDLDVGLAVMICFQVAHLLLIIVVSIKLVKQVSHRTVSGWFLVQSYLSAILLFAGIYSLIYRASSNTFNGVLTSSDRSNEQPDLVHLFISFLYFSCTTMATVGYGDITPSAWYTQIVVLAQMLLTVLYNTVILSIGLSHFSGQTIIHDADQV